MNVSKGTVDYLRKLLLLLVLMLLLVLLPMLLVLMLVRGIGSPTDCCATTALLIQRGSLDDRAVAHRT